MPHSSATHATSVADLWVLSWSAINTQCASGSVATHGAADMRDKISFRAGVAEGGTDHLTGSHLKVCDQCLRAMPGVLEFVQF